MERCCKPNYLGALGVMRGYGVLIRPCTDRKRSGGVLMSEKADDELADDELAGDE
jgi:hypothetical protein